MSTPRSSCFTNIRLKDEVTSQRRNVTSETKQNKTINNWQKPPPKTYGSLVVFYVRFVQCKRVFVWWKMNKNILPSNDTMKKARKRERKRKRMLWIIKFSTISSISSHTVCLLFDMHSLTHLHTHTHPPTYMQIIELGLFRFGMVDDTIFALRFSFARFFPLRFVCLKCVLLDG